MTDPLSQRLQFQIGLRFDMFPPDNVSWKRWAFDPHFQMTRIGQQLTNPRTQLPELDKGSVEELILDPQINPVTGLKKWCWISRCFWLTGAIRILGFDLGLGVFYRKPIDA